MYRFASKPVAVEGSIWLGGLLGFAAALVTAAIILSNSLLPANSGWEHLTRVAQTNRSPHKIVLGTPAGVGETRDGEEGARGVRNSIGLKLVLITAGTFDCGAPPQEIGRVGDEELTATTLADDYYLAATEVTQAQYEQVMGTNPSYFGKSSESSGDLPVEQVSWHDAVEFCRRLSQLPAEQAAGRVYRLPSEAEWEFACRAGGQKAFSFGNQASWLTNYAWFVANGDDQTHPVGKKQPNAFGLFDMHGNVHEWCADVYGGYSPAASAYYENNGNSGRVYRGGSWCISPTRCRAAWRGQQDPDHRSPFNGFRIAMKVFSTQFNSHYPMRTVNRLTRRNSSEGSPTNDLAGSAVTPSCCSLSVSSDLPPVKSLQALVWLEVKRATAKSLWTVATTGYRERLYRRRGRVQ